MTHINYARLREIQNDLVAGRKDVARDGGYLCLECQRVTELDCNGPQNRCAICGSIRLKWLEPLAQDSPRNEWRTKPETKRERLVPVNEAHARFDAMRSAL